MMLDLVLFAVMAIFVLLGVRRGFVRSAVQLVGAVIAAFLAAALGGTVARWVFDALFREALIRKVGESMDAAGLSSVAAAVQRVFDGLPDFLVRAMRAAGITPALVEGTLAHSRENAAVLVTDALAPVLIGLIKVLAGLVLYLLFRMLVRALADMAAGIFRLPLLRQMDGLLGGLCGFLLALVTLWVLFAAVQVFTPMLSPESEAKVNAMLDRSFLIGSMMRANPLGLLFS